MDQEQNIHQEQTQEQESCPICLQPILEFFCSTECKHVFHIHCLVKALDKHIKCPMCRKIILLEPLNMINLRHDVNIRINREPVHEVNNDDIVNIPPQIDTHSNTHHIGISYYRRNRIRRLMHQSRAQRSQRTQAIDVVSSQNSPTSSNNSTDSRQIPASSRIGLQRIMRSIQKIIRC